MQNHSSDKGCPSVYGSRKISAGLVAGAGSVGHGRASRVSSGARELAGERAGPRLIGPVEGAFRLALGAFFNEGGGDFLSTDGTSDVDVAVSTNRKVPAIFGFLLAGPGNVRAVLSEENGVTKLEALIRMIGGGLDGVGDNPLSGEVVARVALQESVNAEETTDDGESRDSKAD